jgi:hypothetical protein
MENESIIEEDISEETTLEKDRCFDFEENDRRGQWLTIKKGDQRVEGAYYERDKANQ